MSKSIKQEVSEYINELIAAAPNVKQSDNVKEYLKIFFADCGDGNSISNLTDNGKMILKALQVNTDRNMWKASDLAERIMCSSHTVSGAMRKLVSEGYVEKIGINPVVYAITEQGKNTVID